MTASEATQPDSTQPTHLQHVHAGFARETLQPPSFLGACLLVVRRNLLHIRRMPELLMDVTVQPVMFVLLFAFVFGGAIKVPGAETGYREFLIPGIMAQTMIFSSFIVALGLVNDLEKGFVDRLKALPIHRSSILVGRSLSSLIHSSIGITVMAVTGLAIGWRMREGFFEAVLAFALYLLMGFAMIWLGILVGSSLRSVEGVQGVMFTTVFPLTFLSNAFVPTEGMPDWLQFLAEWNPVSCLTQAARELWGNGPAAGPDAAWSLQHPVTSTIVWALLITAAMAPLSIRAFRRRSRD